MACDHNVTPKHHEESSQVSRERVEDTEMPLPNLTNDHHEPSKAQSETSQVFQEAPPSNAILPMEGGVHVSYWSHAARKRKLLLRVGNDSNQTLLTHYYSIVDEIERLTHNSIVLSTLRKQESDESKAMLFGPVIRQMIANAERNAVTLPQGIRHPEILKKFATALFIYAGPLAYDFCNITCIMALPSLRTIQRVVHTHYNTMNEGEFNFDGLVAHIAKHNTTNIVTIGEDATRIICRVMS